MPFPTQHVSMPLQLQIVHGTWPVVPQLSRNVILSYLQLLKMIYWTYEFIRAYFYFPWVPMIVFTSIPCHVPLSFDHSKPRSGFRLHIFLAYHILRKKKRVYNFLPCYIFLSVSREFVIYFHYLFCLLFIKSFFYSKVKEFWYYFKWIWIRIVCPNKANVNLFVNWKHSVLIILDIRTTQRFSKLTTKAY